MTRLTDACRHVVEGLLSGRGLHKLKTEASSRFGLSKVPTNLEILAAASPDERKKLFPILRRKPIRTISGVSVVAVMTSPEKCPHGKCIMCPGGPSSNFGNVPQSYTGREPASMRAVQNDFDPYRQVKNRLEQLTGIGHPIDKIELIIQGGTFTSREEKYQRWFVQRCLDAMNGVVDSPGLESAISTNDLLSAVKNIGTTIETRPDCFGEKEIMLALGYGATRVELGLQSIYDDVLGKIGRGHSVRDSIEAIKRSKDAGFKVVLHVMPFLPCSDAKRDFEMFRQLFTNPDFMPDELKIYPTQVIAGTRLHEMTLSGEYTPPAERELVELLSKVKKELVPEFVRIKRVLRDIPATVIEAGTKKTNLRQLLSKECMCIRCREIGHKAYKFGIKPDFSKAILKTIEYDASGGRELFLSFVEPECDALIGLLRLRLSKTAATVRELHVFGSEVALGSGPAGPEAQHLGFGKKLMEEAETLAKSRGFGEMRVISGIGVRQYYRKLGYALEGSYMLKHFK